MAKLIHNLVLVLFDLGDDRHSLGKWLRSEVIQ